MQQTDAAASRMRPRATPLVFTALMAMLPLAAAGDAPGPGKVSAPAAPGKIKNDAPSKAAPRPRNTRLPNATLSLRESPGGQGVVDVTSGRKRSLLSMERLPGRYVDIVVTAPGIRGLVVPVPERDRSAVIQRDLLYRGEDVGPYHPLYLQGVPPGTRIQGVNPPPQRQTPRLQLIMPARPLPRPD